MRYKKRQKVSVFSQKHQLCSGQEHALCALYSRMIEPLGSYTVSYDPYVREIASEACELKVILIHT